PRFCAASAYPSIQRRARRPGYPVRTALRVADALLTHSPQSTPFTIGFHSCSSLDFFLALIKSPYEGAVFAPWVKPHNLEPVTPPVRVVVQLNSWRQGGEQQNR